MPSLIGGAEFEPSEENPMIGFRGASRYYSPRYREGFALECRAIKRLREVMGFTNVDRDDPVLPLDRRRPTACSPTMAENGLKRGERWPQVYVMCEIPSNVILAEAVRRALRRLLDRLATTSRSSRSASTATPSELRRAVRRAGRRREMDDPNASSRRRTGPGPRSASAVRRRATIPEFAEFLVECGIDSISVTPDSFVAVKRHVAEMEAELDGGKILERKSA